MNVLVIGSGGREHALIQKLAKSKLAPRLFALPGNPGMAEAVCLPGNPMDCAATVKTALAQGIDFCVVTPDDPLAIGLVDALEAAGVPCFGPTQAAARIEASKVFAKELMERYGIPTARHAAFSDLQQALAYVQNQPLPLVIKADGLARGKGVIIADTLQEAEAALVDMLAHRAFGDSGSQVVVEEFLTGPEVSVLCLTDGRTLLPLVSAMDHKRALADDRGPNTGGMGVIAPNPFYTEDVAEQAMQTIFQPTLQAMEKEGCPFSGCLFFGLMLTPQGPKVLEYNARFGDPETQAVLELMEGDLLNALMACREGRLHQVHLAQKEGAACCLALCAKGYPGTPESGQSIRHAVTGAALVFAGVKEKDGQLVSSGGRVAFVTATGNSLGEAIRKAYEAAEQVQFAGKTLRPDIGRRALKFLEG